MLANLHFFFFFSKIVAREKNGIAASAPLTMTVILNDVNDNAPRLPMIPPIPIQAGEGHREIVQVNNEEFLQESRCQLIMLSFKVNAKVFHALIFFNQDPKSWYADISPSHKKDCRHATMMTHMFKL